MSSLSSLVVGIGDVVVVVVVVCRSVLSHCPSASLCRIPRTVAAPRHCCWPSLSSLSHIVAIGIVRVGVECWALVVVVVQC